ncbi:hypothetical protein EJ07DRAFT_150820 [Lizonia empirigonia]|nr:hypothetical protein EJ07DRAFT_150820 [Lizonia empirigonia]
MTLQALTCCDNSTAAKLAILDASKLPQTSWTSASIKTHEISVNLRRALASVLRSSAAICYILPHFMSASTALAWDHIGGPWQAVPEAQYIKQYRTLKIAWNRFRLELAQLTTSLEEEAENEALWEIEYHNYDSFTVISQSAAHATVVARTLTRYPVVGILGRRDTNRATSFRRSSSTPLSRHQAKTVRFVPMTTVLADKTFAQDSDQLRNISLSRIGFEPGRPPEKWLRSNDDYEPGVHASGDLEGWADTSFAEDALYNLSQLKVYLNLSHFHLDPPWIDTYRIESEGIACHHRFWNEIQATFDAALQAGRLSKEGLIQAHCLLIGTQNGEFHDVALHMLGDYKGSGNKGWQAKVWTSQLEVIA